MKVLGVTGGIGMGKSTCAKMLVSMGVEVVDTDDLARDLVQPGQPALQEIAERFGLEVLDSDGCLKREELAKRVFISENERAALEQILHPRIRRRWREMVGQWTEQGLQMAAVIIPLLFETGAEAEFDVIFCVACSEQTQRQRLSARGLTQAQISGRLASQLPIQVKMAQSDYVIWSEGGLDLHEEQVRRAIGSVRRGD